MITRNDCALLLKELKDNGVDTQEITIKLFSSPTVSLEVLKFINDNRQLDLTTFYENLRKNYNHKKSKLYGNIVKEIDEPTEIVTTLSALLLQIILFSKTVKNKQLFLRHARADDISKVLNIYLTNYDITNAINLMRIIKADLKSCESIK